MKKPFPVLALFMCMSMTACKKDWLCSCTWYPTTTNYGINSTTRKKAQVVCDSIDRDFRLVGGSCTMRKNKLP